MHHRELSISQFDVFEADLNVLFKRMYQRTNVSADYYRRSLTQRNEKKMCKTNTKTQMQSDFCKASIPHKCLVNTFLKR